MIVARTVKGYGASETADVEGKHGQPLGDPNKAIEELGNVGPAARRRGQAREHRHSAHV